MSMRRRMFAHRGPATVLISMLGAALLGGVAPSTWAAWSATASSPTNQIEAAADWTAPTVTSSTIALSNGKSIGTIGPGSSYHVYADATDDGNPPSGVASVVANLAVLTSGATSAGLTAGPYDLDGTTYQYRSDVLVADAGLVDGAYTYTHRSTDGVGNARDQIDFPVTVDATPPAAVDIQAVNGPGIAERPDTGDVLTLTFSEVIDPESILAGWDGTATPVTVRFLRSGGSTTVTVRDASGQVGLGSMLFDTHYGLTNNTNYDIAGSTMTLSGSAVTVTLGTGSTPGSGTTTTPVDWTVPATIADPVGNTTVAGTVTESGGLDRDW